MDTVLPFLSDLFTVILGVHLYARGMEAWDRYKDNR